MNPYKQLEYLIGTYNNITNFIPTAYSKTNWLHIWFQEQFMKEN